MIFGMMIAIHSINIPADLRHKIDYTFAFAWRNIFVFNVWSAAKESSFQLFVAQSTQKEQE